VPVLGLTRNWFGITAIAAMSTQVGRLRGRVAGQLGGVRVLVGVAVFKADETE
jgi:hypothetical protein